VPLALSGSQKWGRDGSEARPGASKYYYYKQQATSISGNLVDFRGFQRDQGCVFRFPGAQFGDLSNAFAFVARVPVLSLLEFTFCIGKGGPRAKAGRIASNKQASTQKRIADCWDPAPLPTSEYRPTPCISAPLKTSMGDRWAIFPLRLRFFARVPVLSLSEFTSRAGKGGLHQRQNRGPRKNRKRTGKGTY
jgi:hypothetical protein